MPFRDELSEEQKTTMTSESYSKMVDEIEAEIKKVRAENNKDNKNKLTELKKQKRALKNKASAMRCREKKRRRMEDLEKQVADLKTRLLQLEAENKQLRKGTSSSSSSAQAPAAKQARIHYSAPQPTRASSQLITEESSPFAKMEKQPKMSQSRTHAMTPGAFSSSDLDMLEALSSSDASLFGSDDADAFLEPFWEAGDDHKVDVLDAVDTFFNDPNPRSLVGAL